MYARRRLKVGGGEWWRDGWCGVADSALLSRALTDCGRAAHARTSPSRHHRHHHEACQPMKRRHEAVRAVRCTSQRRSKCIDAPAMCAEPCPRVFRRCCGGCHGLRVATGERCVKIILDNLQLVVSTIFPSSVYHEMKYILREVMCLPQCCPRIWSYQWSLGLRHW